MASAAIPLVGGALLGAIQGNEERKQTERFNKGAAEANRFSDVTGQNTALRRDTSGGLFGGAIKGAGAFGGLGGAFGGTPQTPGVSFDKGGLAQNLRQPRQGAFGALGGRTIDPSRIIG